MMEHRDLARGEKEENVILEFRPLPEQDDRVPMVALGGRATTNSSHRITLSACPATQFGLNLANHSRAIASKRIRARDLVCLAFRTRINIGSDQFAGVVALLTRLFEADSRIHAEAPGTPGRQWIFWDSTGASAKEKPRFWRGSCTSLDVHGLQCGGGGGN
jgi:hypothetical protein